MTPVHVIQYYIRLSLLSVQQELGGVVEAIPRAIGNTTAATAMAVPVFESHIKYWSSEFTIRVASHVSRKLYLLSLRTLLTFQLSPITLSVFSS